MENKIKVAVIGAGNFGIRHIEKYRSLENVELRAIVDADNRKTSIVNQRDGETFFDSHKKIIGSVDAVSISVPTSHHFYIARDCLKAGIDVLIEKPITETVAEAQELIEIAESQNLIIQVGHLQRFSPAYLAIAKAITRPLFVEAYRISPFSPRVTDVSVVLDLMIHDIDLITALVAAPLTSIDAIGAPIVSEQEDIVSTRLKFNNGCVANLTASRVSFKTERTMRIFQPDSYIQADLITQKVVIRKRGTGEMFPGIPNIDQEEFTFEETDSLRLEIESFLESVRKRTQARVDGIAGRNAVKTANLITKDLRSHRKFLENSGVV